MEIDLVSKLQNPIEALTTIGKWVASSGMFGCTRPEQGPVIAMACISEKISLIEFKRTYHLYDGNLSMRADAMQAKFRALGGKIKIVSRSSELASIVAVFDGETTPFSFSWNEAKEEPFVKNKSGGIKTNYATPRARMQMLWARVISDCVRALAPEIVAGTFTPEELSDETPADPTPQTGEGINLSAAAAKAKPARVVVEPSPVVATEARVVSVTVEPVPTPSTPPEDAQALADMGLSPGQAPTPPPVVAPAPPAPAPAPAASTEPQFATAEQLYKLNPVIEPNWEKCQAWLIREKKLKTGDSIDRLPFITASRILANVEGWKRAVGIV